MRFAVLLVAVVMVGCSTPFTTACVGEGARVGQMLLPARDGMYRVVTRVVGRAGECRAVEEPVLVEVEYRKGDVVERKFWEVPR